MLPLNVAERSWCTTSNTAQPKRMSYRVQDFVEVHEAYGHRDRLQEDSCEYCEAKALEGERDGHITEFGDTLKSGEVGNHLQPTARRV